MLNKAKALFNLAALADNPYPGRGIVCGLDEGGRNLVQVYWIMGRSENSRNRIFEKEGGRLFTVAADPSKVKDPSLIIYNAMLKAGGGYGMHIVSNGSQTDAMQLGYMKGHSPYQVMNSFMYEPDEPNFTPRISATSRWQYSGEIEIQMSILRKSRWSGMCERNLYQFNDVRKGLGYCIHTYSGDGEPLPSFKGEPYLLPLAGSIDEIANTYWKVLNEENRVALAVKFIPKPNYDDPKIVIINRYTKVQ